MRSLRRPLADGFAGIRQTVVTIAALSLQGSRTPEISRLVQELRHFPPAEIPRALHRAATSRIRYKFDPVDVELVHGVPALLDRGAGDCDDFTVFLSSLGLGLGLPTRITVARSDLRRPFHHVFPEFLLARKWIPVDPVDKISPPGTISPSLVDFRHFYLPRRYNGGK